MAYGPGNFGTGGGFGQNSGGFGNFGGGNYPYNGGNNQYGGGNYPYGNGNAPYGGGDNSFGGGGGSYNGGNRPFGGGNGTNNSGYGTFGGGNGQYPPYGPGGQPPRRPRRGFPWKVLLIVLGGIVLAAGIAALVLFLVNRSGAQDDTADDAAAGVIPYVSEYTEPDPADYAEDDLGGYVSTEILVYIADGVTEQRVDEIAAELGGSVMGRFEAMGLYQIEVPAGTREELEALCEQAEAYDEITLAVLDGVSQSGLNALPTDGFGDDSDWNESNPSGNNWHLEAIHAPTAWTALDSYTGTLTAARAGILDGGIFAGHRDLKVTDQSNTGIKHFHGTFIAGLMGAAWDNNKDIAGVLRTNSGDGQDGRLYFCSIVNTQDELTELESGTYRCTSSAVRDYMCRLLSAGCKVINYSIGTDLASEADPDGAAREAGEEYALVVCDLIGAYGDDFIITQAAGNEDQDAKYCGKFTYVGECAETAAAQRNNGVTAQQISDAVIVVGGVSNTKRDGQWQLFRFSEGRGSNYGSCVDLCAPGENLYSTYEKNWLFSKCEYGSGTSYAAPLVAASAAMLWSIDPTLTAGEVKNYLCSTATETVLPNSANTADTGTYTMLNLGAAVQALLDTHPENAAAEEAFEEAMEQTFADGNWSETMTVTGKAGIGAGALSFDKEIAAMELQMSVQGYDPDNTAATVVHGTGEYSILGFGIDIALDHENGVTTYTEGLLGTQNEIEQSADELLDIILAPTDSLTESMVVGDTIYFTYDPGTFTSSSFSSLGMIDGVEITELDTATLTVVLNSDGTLNTMTYELEGTISAEGTNINGTLTLAYEFY